MEYKLTLSVFRFDAKTDYLAYQKKVVLNIDENATVADMLAMIKEDDKYFGYPSDTNAAIRIEGALVFTKAKIKKIVQDFGKELTLEPLSFKRAVKDLEINDGDFQARFDILDAYVDAVDKRKYKKYIREFYASEILKYNEDYLGDALFAFAYDMIEKYPEKKENILKAIADEENGIWQHIDITNKLYPFDDTLQNKIESLKNMIINTVPKANCVVEQQVKLSSLY